VTQVSLVLPEQLAQLANRVSRDYPDSLDGLVQEEGQVELVLWGLRVHLDLLEMQVKIHSVYFSSYYT